MREYNVRASHNIITFLLLLLIALVVVAMFLVPTLKKWNVLETEMIAETMNADLEDDIYDSVLRFHIRANSDSEEDQRVKLIVKEQVMEAAKEYVQNSSSKEDTKQILGKHLTDLVHVAEKTLAEEGYFYRVKAYFSKEEFPVKKYGDMTFPAGTYEALRMDLGDAEGKNWWCMLYPSLCFVDVTTGIVPEESKEEFQTLLPAEDYEELLATPEEDVEIKSGIWEWIKKRL